MEKRNEFPKRFYLTSRKPVWDLAEVEAWIEQRKLETKTGKVRVRAPDIRKRKRRPIRKA